ncbi:MAG: insulinase family protein [Gemmatimonadetes bacterium]|nr:insulinase family protein [Gemmatimonadota bacterium]
MRRTLLVDRSVPPQPGEVRNFDFPDVRSQRLAHGVDLRVATLPRLPVVTVHLIAHAGEASVTSSEAGLAVLAGESLEGGSAARPGPELAEAFERLGTALEVSVGWDAASVGISCLSERLDDAVRLLAEVVTSPRFPQDEVARLRDRQLAAIEQRQKDPRALANDTASSVIYSPHVPYSRPQLGTRESVGALNAERARAWYGERYRAGGAGLVFAGDVDPARAVSLVESCFAAWAGEPPPEPDFQTTSAVPKTRIVVVHRPGSVQSEIRLGHVGVARDTRDFFPLLVVNTLLGGAFTSRLNLNLRERHGYTYGARSGFSFRRRPGPFLVETAVATNVTADAVREAMHEIEELLRGGPRPDEVADSRAYIVGVFPLQLETTAQVAGRIADLIVHRLPDDYYRVYRDRVVAVTPEDAHQAALSHIHPERTAIVVVGDADAVRAPLEALGIGPVEVREAS